MKRIDFIFSPWFGLKLEKGTEIAFVFLIDDFIEDVEEGYFIDYDGSGCWVDDAGNRLGHIRCDVKWLRENQPADAKFIAWFNK